MKLQTGILLCSTLWGLSSCGPVEPSKDAQETIEIIVDCQEAILDKQLHMYRMFEVMYEEYLNASNYYQREIYAELLNREYGYLGIDFTNYRELTENELKLIKLQIKEEAIKKVKF